jgi:hypothetical protein
MSDAEVTAMLDEITAIDKIYADVAVDEDFVINGLLALSDEELDELEEHEDPYKATGTRRGDF